MSKTILAPFTHARNFLSATAFAAANGILPFGNTKDVKAKEAATNVQTLKGLKNQRLKLLKAQRLKGLKA